MTELFNDFWRIGRPSRVLQEEMRDSEDTGSIGKGFATN